MPVTVRSAFAVLAVASLVACGSSGPEPKDDAEDVAAAEELGRDTDKTVFDDMIQTEDRARATEGVTLGTKDALDQALESQEGDAPAADE